MTQRRLPAGFNTADENDIIQKGADGLWYTRGAAEIALPSTGVSYVPSTPADWPAPDPVNVGLALDKLAALDRFACYEFNTGAPVATGVRIPLTLGEEQGGFTVSGGNTVVCPGGASVRHLALMVGSFKSASVTNPTTIALQFTHGGMPALSVQRHSTNANEWLQLSLLTVFNATQAIEISGDALTAVGSLFVLRLL